MCVKVNTKELITKVRENAKHLGKYTFTYDNQFDILRVWLEPNFKELELEPVSDNVYVTKENNKVVFIEIHDFMNSFDFINDYLPKDINNCLLKARSLLIKLNKEEN